MILATQIVLVLIFVVGLYVLYRALTDQLNEVHVLVNSNLARVKADLEIALDRINQLETLLSRKGK